MQNVFFVDVDYCRFEDCGFMKPTRFYGSTHLANLESVCCDGPSCPGLEMDRPVLPGHARKHRWCKGGKGRVMREDAYRIPEGVVEYVLGLAPAPEPWVVGNASPKGGKMPHTLIEKVR